MEETDCLTQGWAQEGRESKMGSAKPLMEAVFGTDGYVAQGLSAARAEATRAARGTTNIARDDTFFFFGERREGKVEVLGEVAGFIYFWVQKKKRSRCLSAGRPFFFKCGLFWAPLGVSGPDGALFTVMGIPKADR